MKRLISSAAMFLALQLLASCASSPLADAQVPAPSALPGAAGDQAGARTDAGEPATTAESSPRELARVSLGSGSFVRSTQRDEGEAVATDDGVTLNFENGDLREFLQVVFETILNESYLIDPRVSGNVTLHTVRPVARASVIPIMEAVLLKNGAAVVLDRGIYRIVPIADAEGMAGTPSVGRNAVGRAADGYSIQVVPLEHVSAAEIQKIVGPFVPGGSTIRTDATRNVLIVSGPRYRVDELLATIRTFDVDWLKGMSFGMFRLQYADAAALIGELQSIIGENGVSPLSGIVRLIPVERLNAVLVIAHRPQHIAEIERIVEQLDWGVEGSAGRRLYVYELENGKAENIARALQEIFAPAGSSPASGSTRSSAVANEASRQFQSSLALTSPPPAPGSAPEIAITDDQNGVLAESRGDIKIIPDPDNNAILVLAGQEDYRAIEAAIRRLDISPRQVLIEATIAEVTLSNTLAYGVRWFFENTDWQLGFNAPVPQTAAGTGLAFAFFDDSSDLTAFFDVLATESSVKFLSTPQVMVLDNQTANIRVGDQIPVTTRSSQSTIDPDAPIVTEVQFRDTGTLLTVTPRINAGGQVTLEISQEVSLPGTEPAVGGGGNVAIAQRTINSSVIVQSGQTVVLGGLILDNTNDGKSGIPVLMNLPFVGALFSTDSQDRFRTELIVTVTPRVVENERELRRVTDELRERMKNASEVEKLITKPMRGA